MSEGSVECYTVFITGKKNAMHNRAYVKNISKEIKEHTVENNGGRQRIIERSFMVLCEACNFGDGADAEGQCVKY